MTIRETIKKGQCCIAPCDPPTCKSCDWFVDNIIAALRASTPDDATVERMAKAICQSGKFETGQGTCSLFCLDHLGDARRNCSHAPRLHKKLALAVWGAQWETGE